MPLMCDLQLSSLRLLIETASVDFHFINICLARCSEETPKLVLLAFAKSTRKQFETDDFNQVITVQSSSLFSCV